MPALFAVTLFLSSGLLFLVQPMIARMVLPLLGGAPAVWNTCMLFFQAVLLAGYAYAHAGTRWLGARPLVALHLGLLVVAGLLLPPALPAEWTPPGDRNPAPWLLAVLAVSIGLPFFVLSAAAPLLQKWFVATGHPSGRDPYFLYAASNLGSMVALLSYPFLLEPLATLHTHRWLWAGGFVVLVPLMAACAAAVWRSRSVASGQWPVARKDRLTTGHSPLTTARKLRWIALSFVPSSLLLSVTSYLTTDVAAVPLLWVVPLALYLLTFILAFARRPPVPHEGVVWAWPRLLVLLAFVMLTEATEPAWLLFLAHLGVFFVTALASHGALAGDRPPADHLTEFYLWVSVGGAVGGLFNALAAPLVFNGFVEYPLVLVLACLLRRPSDGGGEKPGVTRADVVAPLALGAATVAAVLGGQALGLTATLGERAGALVFALPVLIAYTFLTRPVRFGLAVGALFVAGAFFEGAHGRVVYRERSFGGLHRVTLDPTGRVYQLVHGNTFHGRQARGTAGPPEPLAYYHRTGPAGGLFAAYSGADAKKEVAVVGLGAGSLAAYGEPGQRFTFYEIDPAVARIARDGRFFTFLRDCRADWDVVLGDARLTLRDAPDGRFGLIVLDAFSSDAIPLHLLTREALRLYLEKLADGGVLAFHISNRYLDIEPVLADLAGDARLTCWTRRDLVLNPDEREAGKSPSQWVVMAREKAHLEKLVRDRRWELARGGRPPSVWTDDFSNLLGALRWEEEK